MCAVTLQPVFLLSNLLLNVSDVKQPVPSMPFSVVTANRVPFLNHYTMCTYCILANIFEQLTRIADHSLPFKTAYSMLAGTAL